MPTTTEETPAVVEEKPQPAVSIKGSVAAAVAEVEKPAEHAEEEKKPEAAKVEEAKDSPEDIAQALQLYKALKDPKTSGDVIEYIAKQGGFVKQAAAATDKTEVKEVAADLVDLLKESLGAEFEFLGDKIAPAIKKYLTGEFEKQQADIRQALENQEREKHEVQSLKTLTKLSTDFFGEEKMPDNVTEEMSKLMDKIKPDADMGIKEYLELIFDTAKGRLGLVKTTKSKEKKLETNRTDVAARLASDRAAERMGKPVATISKTITLKNAIQSAIDQLNNEG